MTAQMRHKKDLDSAGGGSINLEIDSNTVSLGLA